MLLAHVLYQKWNTKKQLYHIVYSKLLEDGLLQKLLDIVQKHVAYGYGAIIISNLFVIPLKLHQKKINKSLL